MARRLDPDKRERILEAAIRVFARNGYRKSSVEEIAREAGIAKGGLYLYFTGKEELFGEAFLSCFEADRETLREAIANSRSPERTLRFLFDRWANLPPELEESLGLFLDFLAECGRDRVRESIRQRAADLYEEFWDLVADLLRGGIRRGQVRRGVEPRATAQAVLAFWDGLYAARYVTGEAVDLRRVSRAHLRLLLRGMRP